MEIESSHRAEKCLYKQLVIAATSRTSQSLYRFKVHQTVVAQQVQRINIEMNKSVVALGLEALQENGEILISGRELHEFLEIGTEYAKWFSRMAEYGFEENEDYVVIVKNDENPKGGRPSVNHAMKIDMAKKISMLQRNEKGKEARQYFIKCEKKLREIIQSNTPALPTTYKDALIALVAEVEAKEQLQLEVKAKEEVIQEMKPKVIRQSCTE